ncbi:hypothetical protein LZ554_001523 [Drepanopeziza brunnea f. sp. 'monogermtubi']|nr:hypothetical protein LZ554_001523 [Drepanopeziza brunnea f. sp. 'monogermtubi']
MNPYEVEHNIKATPQARSRRPDMSTFFSHLAQIETPSAQTNTHATPTPVAIAAAERLLQEQFQALQQNLAVGSSTGTGADADSDAHAHVAVLEGLIATLQADIEAPPRKSPGVPQSYLDELDRVPKKALRAGDVCPICNEEFLDDAFPLVVQLPCHASHRFDLECVGPWLRLQGTCPLDRKEMLKKKEVVKVVEEEQEEEDYDEMFA